MRILGLLLALVMFASPAVAGKAKTEKALTGQVISTAGGAVTVTITEPAHSSAYLIVETSAETATASLAITASLVNALGNTVLCTATAITTDTVTTILLGSTVAAGEGITDACDFPLGRATLLSFTVTGGGADFTVEADLEWISE
jgi:hypothetical protein